MAKRSTKKSKKFVWLDRWRIATIVLLAILTIDAVNASWLYDDWMATRTERWRRIAAIHSRYTLKRQPHYEFLRRRNDVLVSESHPAILPPPPSGSIIPVVSHIETTEPVIFVTIDDGLFKDQHAAEYMTSMHLPFTLFLTTDAIKQDYPFFERFQAVGMGLENHTATHPHLKKFPIEVQRAELCSNNDDMTAHYGRRPVLFRPPYGEYNDLTLQAAKDCGIKAVVMWNVVVNQGKLEFQPSYTQLKPGDIVLLHFRPELLQDIQTVLTLAHQQNLSVANLEDWL